jgi:thiol-disulfide isomerase/thioredoxin
MKMPIRMLRWMGVLSLLTAAILLPVIYSDKLGAHEIDPPRPLPEFTSQDAASWINSMPLKRADLLGRVTLIDIWTFDCWNCYRSFPWLKEVERRYADRGLRVVGIHTPEYQHEREQAAVKSKVAEFKLAHPVMLDNDYAYWRALGNRYWPAYYLVDKQGRLRHLFVGETHDGDRRAKLVDQHIQRLLAE